MLFCGIIDDVFQQVQLLFQHGLCIVILYFQVFEIDVHPFHIDFHCHSVVIEGLRDVLQFFKTGDIGFYQCDLLGGDLPQVIHFADLQDEVFPRLFVGEAVHLVHRPRNGDAGVEGLVIEWHLELQSCVGTVLQGMSHIVGIAVS